MARVFGGWLSMASKLWRNSPLRLLGVYTGIFAIGVIFLLGMVSLHLTASIEHATDVIIEWQMQYLSTLDPPQLRNIIASRIEDKTIRDEHYGLFAANGTYIAGDIVVQPARPAGIGTGGWTLSEVMLRGNTRSEEMRLVARQRADGDWLYDGRDLDTITDIRHAFIGFLVYGGALVLIASIIVGATYARRQIRRMHAIQAVVTQIADGALHLRLPEEGQDDIASLNALVNTMLDDIERLMAEVKGACDGIAHDLRTPLAQVQLLLDEIEQLARQPETEPPSRLRLPSGGVPPDETRNDQIVTAVEKAAAATERLHQRFNAMLRISELHATRRRTGFADVDLNGLIVQLSALYEPVARERSLQWQTDVSTSPSSTPMLVFADEMLLFEVLSNLVDNAIKFTPMGGAVSISLKKAAGKPTITISDTGPGIPPAERQAVFSPFYRQSSHAALEGSGLGLSIVGAILKLHQFPYALGETRPGHAAPGLRLSILCYPTPDSR